jgi:hypothetical protein
VYIVLSKRLQILIDSERYDRLVAQARERHVSVAAVIRDAIDDALPAASERVAAARQILAAAPMPVPDPGELRDELDELRARRA